jgi:YD repeat-containing protein
MITNNRYKIRLPRRNPYDSQGRVWKSLAKAGNDIRTTEYKYDMFGNIIETIQPDGTTIKAGYNDKGQKISETNQLGQTRYFEYDDNGQSLVYQYTYDAQGNQLTIKDPNENVTKFAYDDNGNQLTREFLFLIYVMVYFLCPARGSTLITVGFSLRSINTPTSPARDDTLFLRVKHNVANEF